MSAFLRDRVKRLAENYNTIHRGYRLQMFTQKRLAAFFYAEKDLPVPLEKIRRTEEEIKSLAGIFSPARGLAMLPLATSLTLEDDPRLLTRAQTLYRHLRNHFMRSDHLVMTALELAKYADEKNMDETIDRLRALYRGLRQGHRLRVGADDLLLIARLALLDEPVEILIKQVNLTYEALRTALPAGGALIGVAQYLVLSGNASAKLLKVSELARRFTEYGHRMTGRNYVRVLAVLANSDKGPHTLIGETIALYEELKKERGFSGWYAQRYEILLYVAAFVAREDMPLALQQEQTAYVSCVATSIAVSAAASG